MLEAYLKNKDFKRIGENFSALMLLQIANYLLPLISIPYLVRILGPEKFGLVMFAQSICVFLGVFVDFGFNLSATRAISTSDNKVERSKIFYAVIWIKSILMFFTFLVFVLCVESIGRLTTDRAVYYLSYLFILGQMLFPDWFFQGIQKMKIITILTVSAKVFFTVLVFFYVKRPEDFLMVPVLNGGGQILIGIVAIIICHKYISYTSPSLDTVKLAFRESYTLFISNVASRFLNSANIIILGWIGGNTIAGIFSSIEKLLLAGKSLFLPFYRSIFPWLSNQSREKQINATKNLGKVIVVIGLAAVLVCFFFGSTILQLIYANKEISNYSSAFKIGALAIPFAALNMTIVSLYLPAIKAYKARMWLIIGAGVLNVILVTILTFQYSLYGTIVGSVIAEFCLMSVAWYVGFKKLIV